MGGSLSFSHGATAGGDPPKKQIAKHNLVNRHSISIATRNAKRLSSTQERIDAGVYRRRASMERPAAPHEVQSVAAGNRVRRGSAPIPFIEPPVKSSEVRNEDAPRSWCHPQLEQNMVGEDGTSKSNLRTEGLMTVVNPSGTTNLVMLNIEFDGCRMKNFTPSAVAGDARAADDLVPCGDECVAVEMFAGDRHCCFFAVLDGHGEYGHNASSFIRERLSSNVEEIVRAGTHTYKESLLLGLQTAADELLASECNVLMSGCTVAAVLVKDDAVFVANVGNAHCVLGYRETVAEVRKRLTSEGLSAEAAAIAAPRQSKLISFQLTDEHVPDVDAEKKRLCSAGARLVKGVSELGDDAPLRVFLQNQDVPGLALSRSIGDAIASTVGVISTPSAGAYRLGPEYEYLVLATKGVWNVITPDEAIAFVDREYRAYVVSELKDSSGLGLSNRDKRTRREKLAGASKLLSQLLVKFACQRWLDNEVSVAAPSIDDITALVLVYL